MEMNGRIKHVKKVSKQMKKACPVEIGLAHVRTALAQALHFANWNALIQALPPEFSAEFQTNALKVSTNPSDPTFLAAVKRFAKSSGVDQKISHPLCVEFLPQALERWHTWKDRRPDIREPAKLDTELLDSSHEQKDGREERAENQPLLAASASDAGVRLITQDQRVSAVVVRKKRRTFRSS